MSNMQPTTTLPRIDGITAQMAAGIAMLAPHDPGETSGTGRSPTAIETAVRQSLRIFRSLCRIPNSSAIVSSPASTVERCLAVVSMVSEEDAAELAGMLMALAVIQEQVKEILDDETETEVFADTTSFRLQVWDAQFGEYVRGGFHHTFVFGDGHDVALSLRERAALDAARTTMQEIADLGDNAEVGTAAQRAAFGGIAWRKVLQWQTVHGEAAFAHPSPVAIAAE